MFMEGIVLHQKADLLVVIPAFNEEESLKNTVEELKAKAQGVEYIVVNDGSKDRTKDICLENGYPIIDLPVNGGLTVGFQAGMKYAVRHGYDRVIQFDADGQHDPSFIAAMSECMDETNADIVVGSRFLTRRKERSARMFGSKIITLLIKLTTGKRVSDPTSGMRMYNRSMIEQFATDNTLNPEPETLSRLIRNGAKVKEVQVEMRERQAGVSYLNLTKSAAYMVRVCTSILFVQWFR